MRLTDEQRARRRATRINNGLKKQYPLFAGQWATTPEEQLAEIRRLDAEFEAAEERRRALDRSFRDNAAVYRAAVAEYVTAEELAQLDERVLIYPNAGAYLVGFWRKQHMIIVEGRPVRAWTLPRFDRTI